MLKRTVYYAIYAHTYEGIAEFLTLHKVLPEDVIDIRKDSDGYKAMYVKEVIDA